MATSHSARTSTAYRFPRLLLPLPFLLVGCLTPAPRPTPLTAAVPSGAPKPHGGQSDAREDDDADSIPSSVKAYAKVIPATAKTRRGLFITHRVGDKLYFEIPQNELGKEVLLASSLARVQTEDPENGPYGGDEVNERVLRWERDGNRVILRSPSYTLTADSTQSVAQAVATSTYAPIIAIFPVQAYGPDSAPVINVTRLYTTAVPEFVGLHGNLVEGRSYVERVAAFPDNVEVEATQTVMSGGDETPTSQSALVHWSMVRLPDHPMRPRRADERVGYITVSRYDFGTAEQRVAHRDYITRWRLEKQDPGAALSDPVTPITFYIDPGIPDRWKPWVKKGIEDWQPAFEAAGFSHAIVAKDVPAHDPDWSIEDVRHTSIRWLSSTTENAYGGPALTDPRTGEIINGTVHLYHNVLNLLRDWYIVQVGPLDARAQQLPLPDSLMGRLLEYVVAHEVGHSLGLPHDQLGSSEYPADSIRSRAWVHRMGHTPSLMDYSRFNYVAQPEDSIPVADLVPRLGPYDLYSIQWGYTPIPTAATTDAERPTLDRWAREQDTVPWYRFSEDNAGGYGTLSEAVGDANPVRSTGYGIKNIRRVLGFLEHEALQPGEDNSDLQELYQRALGQWQREMLHVVTVVGGSTVQYKSGSQPGAVYAPIPAAQQRAAVRFLDSAAFHTPMYFVDAPLTRRFEAVGTLQRIVGTETRILTSLLATPRLHRIAEDEVVATNHETVYPLAQMLAEVRDGVWTELAERRVTIDPYRQGLQQAYLEQLNAKLNPPKALSEPKRQAKDPAGTEGLSAEERALLRGELMALRTDVQRSLPHTVDRTTRLHLQTVSDEIGRILNPMRGGAA